MTYKQVNAATEGKFEDVEVAWGGRPLQRQLAEFKFKQVGDQRHACDLSHSQYFVCTCGFINFFVGNGHSLGV